MRQRGMVASADQCVATVPASRSNQVPFRKSSTRQSSASGIVQLLITAMIRRQQSWSNNRIKAYPPLGMVPPLPQTYAGGRSAALR